MNSNIKDCGLKIQIPKANMYNIDKSMAQTQLIWTEMLIW